MKKILFSTLLAFCSFSCIPAQAKTQPSNKNQSRSLTKEEKKQQKAQKKYAKAQRKAERKMLKTEKKNTHYPQHSLGR